MPNLNIGFPAMWFCDQELLHSRVRLLADQDMGDGSKLYKGEVFRVDCVLSGIRKERRLVLSNHQRQFMVPVRAVWCELLLPWPKRLEGKRDGRK